MDKSVLISIRPKWCEKIVNGEKTIEVRKTRPKLQTPFKCYIYHSQAHTSHESGVSASGCVAPSPSRHRRAEGGEMRCNRRRRQKVL